MFKLIWSIWLLVASIAPVLSANPTVLLNIVYDGQNRANTGYDDALKHPLNYDETAMFISGEKQDGLSAECSALGLFAEFLAAEGTAGGIGPVLQGQAGVDRAIAQIEAEGGQVLGTEITVDAGGVRTRPRFVYPKCRRFIFICGGEERTECRTDSKSNNRLSCYPSGGSSPSGCECRQYWCSDSGCSTRADSSEGDYLPMMYGHCFRRIHQRRL